MKKYIFSFWLALGLLGPLFSQNSQTLSLPQGWSLFSTYIIPGNPHLSVLLGPVLQEVQIVKNGSGKTYWPSFNVNTIGNLNPLEGYFIRMNSPQTLQISGSQSNPTQVQIPLPIGWSMVAYLHSQTAVAGNMLSPLSGNLLIAKSGTGQVFWPAMGVNTLVDLSPGQGYLVKLTNSALFSYPGLVPEISTTSVSGIGPTSAQTGGAVSFQGGSSVVARGVCWNETGQPSLADSFTTDGAGSGAFFSTLSGLASGVTYAVRAYATNGHGTSYGNELYFTTTIPPCGTDSLTDYDGNSYNTLPLGEQCWMQENLRATHYDDGTVVPLVTGNSSWGNLVATSKAYCFFDNSAGNASVYGALYTWAAAMNGMPDSTAQAAGVQGICPAGWHIPSDTDWKQMEIFLGMAQAGADSTGWRGTNQGGQLKEAGLVHWLSPNLGATNSSGFTALPGGYRGGNGAFNVLGYGGFWWTGSAFSSTTAFRRDLNWDNVKVYRLDNPMDYGFAVRCVRNNPPSVQVPVVSTVAPSTILQTSAIGGGEVSASGGAPVTARGVCWNTTGNPVISDAHTNNGPGIGSFESILTDLVPGTVYFVRAYATNFEGTGYGSEIQFSSLANLPTATPQLLPLPPKPQSIPEGK